MSGLKWILYSLAGVIFTAALALGIYAWTPAPPPVDRDALLASGETYDVEIIRDSFGVPHIYGVTDPDVAFGLGYAQAEDDWATVQTVIAATRGELSVHDGIAAAPTDYLIDLFGFWEMVEGEYETGIPDDVRALAEAYADGLNLYAAAHPGEVWEGILPVRGQDVVAGFVFRTPFFYGMQHTLRRINDGEYNLNLDSTEQAFQWTPALSAPTGSNAVAVAPSRSADGATRLLVNSHQPFTGPVAWYQIRLHSDDGWDVAGGTFPGAPLMLHGHNRHLGWANTVNHPDVHDVYRLTLNPDNPNQYWFDGEWRDLDVGTASFRVHLFGPFSWPVARETLRSVHGPVMRSGDEAFAIRYAGMSEVRQLEQYYRLNRAENFEEWAAAMRMQALPSINYVYADEDGNIAYIYNAQMPVRVEGYDWQGVLPGDDPALVWNAFEPLDALPMVINPRSGFVINSNNTPFRATDPADDVDPADYPARFGIETHMTNRAMRALALFGTDLSITDAEFLTYKFDVGYDRASPTAQIVEEVLALDPEGDETFAAGQEVLRNWNYMADMESTSAALVTLTATPMLAADNNQTDRPDLRGTFEAAIDQLMEHYGRLDPRWGDVNRIIRGDVNVPVSGAPDSLRAIWTLNELDENGQLNGFAGDTLIAVAEWDVDGNLRSRMIHQYGSATLDESSPHYADQVEMFAREELREMPLEEDAVRAEAERIYRPGRSD